eukprot:2391407-Prymnesium_polylepis.1
MPYEGWEACHIKRARRAILGTTAQLLRALAQNISRTPNRPLKPSARRPAHAGPMPAVQTGPMPAVQTEPVPRRLAHAQQTERGAAWRGLRVASGCFGLLRVASGCFGLRVSAGRTVPRSTRQMRTRTTRLVFAPGSCRQECRSASAPAA